MTFYGELYYSDYVFDPRVIVSEKINTVNSVSGLISENFEEAELFKKLHLTNTIVRIICRYGEYIAESELKKKKITNRGRRKTKRIKYRQKDEIERTFGSQIMFTIVRIYGDVVKKYKLLLFRTGQFTLTGLPEGIDGIINDVVGELCVYLSVILEKEVKIISYSPTMHNYKFSINNNIDLFELTDLLVEKSKDTIIFKLQNLRNFLMYPTFEDVRNSPSNGNTWTSNILISEIYESTLRDHLVQPFKKYETDNIRAPISLLLKYANEMIQYYKIFLEIYKYMARTYYHVPKFYNKLIETIVDKFLSKRMNELRFSDENIIRIFNYDSEKYQGFKLRLYSPAFNRKADKLITIILFNKGKINIKGAKFEFTAIVIRKWLNTFLLKNKDRIIYDPKDILENMSDEEPLYTS